MRLRVIFPRYINHRAERNRSEETSFTNEHREPNILPPSEKAYRARLYSSYRSTHRGVVPGEASAALASGGPYLRRVIRKFVPPERTTKVLDLGCGFGNMLYWLKRAGYQNLTGVDGSQEQVESAHSLGLDCVQQGDIGDYLRGIRESSFDLVFALDLIEHFGKQEALELLDRIFRVMTPGGLLILHLPNGEGIFSGSAAHGDFTHELLLNRFSVQQLLRCAGFHEIRIFEDVPVVHGVASAIRHVAWKVFRSFFRLGYIAETGDASGEIVLTQNFLVTARRPPLQEGNVTL